MRLFLTVLLQLKISCGMWPCYFPARVWFSSGSYTLLCLIAVVFQSSKPSFRGQYNPATCWALQRRVLKTDLSLLLWSRYSMSGGLFLWVQITQKKKSFAVKRSLMRNRYGCTKLQLSNTPRTLRTHASEVVFLSQTTSAITTGGDISKAGCAWTEY